ncbi:MAG: BspA family leucine-rich repeat surface protein, partial [Erysipelotrichaceae bacterium]|nr:BspA family leucine-rich repeat surface protein [Erysipelotrichaceae bacterium]
VLYFQAGVLEQSDDYGFWENTFDIKGVKVVPNEKHDKLILPPHSEFLFAYTEAEIIETEKMDTSRVTNMGGMFYYDRYLKNLDLSGFDTSNVVDMSSMFVDCQQIERLYLRNFDTSHVQNMSRMFDSCYSLIDVDVSSFNTSQVFSMEGMFNDCENLTILDLSNFDTSNVGEMSLMFDRCLKLTVLDLSSFNTRRLNSTYKMFHDDTALQEVNFSESMFNRRFRAEALPEDDVIWEKMDDPTNRKTWNEMNGSWSAEDAGWRKADRNHFLLNLNTNGGTMIALKYLEKGSTADLSIYKPAKAGHDFTGWYTDSELKNKAGSQIEMNSDKTLYAGWQVQNRTLNFNSNGGSEIKAVTASYGSTVDLKNYKPEKEGSLFTGWYSDPECKNKADEAFALKDSTTLYAGWKAEEWTLTLHADGSSKAVQVDKGKAVD